MRAKSALLCLATLIAATAAAQEPSKTPDATQLYCSGTVSAQQFPTDAYMISGEESGTKVVFSSGDLVYINRGATQGVKVGDEFQVVRAVTDHLKYSWTPWQTRLLRAMGTVYADLGRLRVMHVAPKVSTAKIEFSCAYMQRGDLVLPFVERPAPPYRVTSILNPFTPTNGKPVAMLVAAKDFAVAIGTNAIVYVNLGSGQGVKVGDYFRIFRHQGAQNESVYQTYGTAYSMYGFGSTPVRYQWNDLPREILGEGIVLRVTTNAAIVLVTTSRRQMFLGDYVELE